MYKIRVFQREMRGGLQTSVEDPIVEEGDNAQGDQDTGLELAPTLTSTVVR